MEQGGPQEAICAGQSWAGTESSGCDRQGLWIQDSFLSILQVELTGFMGCSYLWLSKRELSRMYHSPISDPDKAHLMQTWAM